MLDKIDTVAQEHPLKMRARHHRAEVGATIGEIVAAHDLPPKYGLPVVVLVRNGRHWPVPMDMWGKVRPKSGTRVEIGYPVHGEAIALVATALLPSAGTALAGALGVTSALGVTLITAAVTIVGGLLIQALIPPPSQDQKDDDPNFSITGVQNAENRYGIYPKVLGRRRMFPPLTARGYSETRNREDIYFYGRMTFGWGPVALEDVRIGTTPITEFEGILLDFVNVDEDETLALSPELEDITRAWRSGTDVLQVMPDDIAEDAYNVALNYNEAVVRATRDRTESVSIDITYPGGFVVYDKEGNPGIAYASFSFRYRKLGTSTWTSSGDKIFRGATGSLMRFTKNINLPGPDEYEIEVKKTVFDTDESRIRDDAFLTGIRSIRSGKLPSHDGIAEMAFRLKASEELNGRVQTLNAIVHQMAPVWSGSSWSAPQRVRHPAWIYADGLRGKHLRRPVEDAKIDLDALKDWADEEDHWTCDYVVDTPTQVSEVLDLICATGRAKKTLADMKYSVIRDGAQGPIRQVFTPRNSWGFRGAVSFPREIHGFRTIVTSERLDWQRDEITVYADGYDVNTASKFETLDLPGVVVTDDDETQGNAYRLGRYHLAQAILRPEQFEWNADWESMRVTRGDKAQLVHDVPVIGVGSGRIKSIDASGSTLTSITLDEEMDVEAGDYRVTVRAADGERHIYQANVATDGAVTTWTYDSGTIDATDLAVGDLVAIELTSQESMEVLLTAIYPNPDGSARLMGVPAAPAVLDADSGTIPAYDPVVTEPYANANFGPPKPVVRNLVSDQATALLERGGTLKPRAAVVLESVITQQGAGVAVQARSRRVDVDEDWAYGEMQPPAAAVAYTAALITGQSYVVQVRAIGDIGAFRGWVDAGQIVAATSDVPPADVTGFQVVPSEGFVQMQWIDPILFDLSHVEIRYSSSNSASWNASTLLSKVPYPQLAFSISARAGTYMIKWVDRGGAKSTNAASVYISEAQLKAANAVELLTVSPGFSGAFSDTEVVAGNLQLEPDGSGNYPATGTWTSDAPVDLGQKYPVKITPQIEAVGVSVNDFMANWTSLAAVDAIGASNPDAWGLAIDIAVSDSDPTGGTDWRPLTGGDYIGRYFNFRVTLTTERDDTTPRVEELSFELDMPDRVEGQEGIASGTGGKTITYSPAYRVSPAVVVTPQNLPSGGYMVLSAQSRTGFTVEFFNSSDTSIDVTFDWVTRGYGRESA